MKNFDYVSFGARVIDAAIVVAAAIVAVTSYAYTAFLIWWDENGETVKSYVPVMRERFEDLVAGLRQLTVFFYDMGRGTAHLLSFGADTLYFASLDI